MGKSYFCYKCDTENFFPFHESFVCDHPTVSGSHNLLDKEDRNDAFLISSSCCFDDFPSHVDAL